MTDVFPAHAGMNRGRSTERPFFAVVFPAHAGMKANGVDRWITGECSPPTRG